MTRPIRTILVATDLQASSRHVVGVAATLARAATARLVLVHAVDDGALRGAPRNQRAALRERLLEDADRGLERQAAELEKGGLAVHPLRVDGGAAHRLILDRIEALGPDLVVAGSHAREGRGHLLGSTADRLLRSTPVPCLIVRGEAEPPFRRIAAPTDFSARARRASELIVAWGSTLAAERARIDLIHAGSAELLGLDPATAELAERGLEKAVAGLREMAGATLTIEGRAIWCTRTVDGILGALDEGDYDLVVVATHGLGPVRRALVGSVAMGLAQSAPCPVLVVPDARRS